MKRKIVLILFVLVAFCSNIANAQTEYKMGTTRYVNNACGVIITDNGGLGGDYGNYRRDTMTLWATSPAIPTSTPMIKITIDELDIDQGDSLFIYNSPNADPSKLFYMGGLNAPFLNNSNNPINPEGGYSIEATIQNSTGALTLVFVSNGSIRAKGFNARVFCLPTCQRIIAQIDTVLTQPKPHLTSADSGFMYIDLCEKDTLKICAKALFLDNGFSYTQTYDSCRFEWKLGDTAITVIGNPCVSRKFTPGNGYDVSLGIKDQRECISYNPATVRIRTSVNPLVQVQHLDDICSSSSVDLIAGTGINSDIIVKPFESHVTSSLTYDSTMFVPDGPNCEGSTGTQCYNTILTFTSFPATALISSGTDILSVCFTMEHSFLGDLNFSIVCPNGTAVLLHPDHCNPNSSIFLGIANESDNNSNLCDPNTNPPGTGWNYCWSEVPTYDYHGPDGSNHYLNQDQTPPRCDSTTRVSNAFPIGEGFYKPLNSFDGLIGCPLNGSWAIKICDTWGIDNGYIFEWELNLDKRLLSSPWSYHVDIDSVYWTGEGVQYISPELSRVTPVTPGIYYYGFHIVDSFGCQYDSIAPINVVVLPKPNLGPDTAFCEKTPLVLNPNYSIDTLNLSYLWNKDNNTDKTYLTSSAGTYIVTITNDNGIIKCSNSDTINVIVNNNPIIDFNMIDSAGCEPLLTKFNNTTTYSLGDTITYEWIFGDPNSSNNTSTALNPEHLYNNYGDYSITLKAISDKGCGDEITRYNNVVVYPVPVAEFAANPNPTTLSENPTVVFTNYTQRYYPGDIIWLWDFKDDNTSAEFNPSNTYTNPDDYKVLLTATTSHGCTDTISHTVIVEDELFVPNIITPNKDGVNDVLVIGNLNLNRDNVLKIYNRYGKKVYEKINYRTTAVCKKLSPDGTKWNCRKETFVNEDQGWTAEGLSDGVYYYTLEYDSYIKKVLMNGSISIYSE